MICIRRNVILWLENREMTWTLQMRDLLPPLIYRNVVSLHLLLIEIDGMASMFVHHWRKLLLGS
jgi:hypothetical protein